MIRIRTNRRVNARERSYRRRIDAHPAGSIRVVARRAAYPAAIRLVRECRADCPGTYLYVKAYSGDGFNVVELLPK